MELSANVSIWQVLYRPSAEYALGTFTNKMDLPSGDQDSGYDGVPGGIVTGNDHVPEVSRF